MLIDPATNRVVLPLDRLARRLWRGGRHASQEANRAVKLFGTDVADSKGRSLRAGAISAMLDNGALRYIKLGDVEVLRAIAFLVRDENWGTFTPKIANLKVNKSKSGFKVGYDATCGDGKSELAYRADISCTAEGVLIRRIGDAKGRFQDQSHGFHRAASAQRCGGQPVTDRACRWQER